MTEVKMGVYDRNTKKLMDFGTYKTVKEALNDLINFDIPRNRYGVIEAPEFTGRVDTIKEAEKLKKVI